jgi:hypothetical protein
MTGSNPAPSNGERVVGLKETGASWLLQATIVIFGDVMHGRLYAGFYGCRVIDSWLIGG